MVITQSLPVVLLACILACFAFPRVTIALMFFSSLKIMKK